MPQVGQTWAKACTLKDAAVLKCSWVTAVLYAPNLNICLNLHNMHMTPAVVPRTIQNASILRWPMCQIIASTSIRSKRYVCPQIGQVYSMEPDYPKGHATTTLEQQDSIACISKICEQMHNLDPRDGTHLQHAHQ